MTAIQNIISDCIELKRKLINRGTTKFMKIWGDVNSPELWQVLKTDF